VPHPGRRGRVGAGPGGRPRPRRGGRAVTHRDVIAQLSDAAGVSGAEGPVRDLIWSHLRGRVDEAFTDTMGNLFVARHKGRRGPRIMVSAHMDEVGLMITYVEKDGTLRFTPVGGIDRR